MNSTPREDQKTTEAMEEVAPFAAPEVFEFIRREGVDELRRPPSALVMSALIAGLALGFSVLGKGLFHLYLPDATWRPLVENLGYSIGFLIVIMGRMQLFTENTITAVTPFLARPNRIVFQRLMRLWGIVLFFNLLGAAVCGWIFLQFRYLNPDLYQSLLDISHHALDKPFLHLVLLGIGAGWLIAALVWMMPNANGGKITLIIVVTWLISLAEFSHVIAGTGEASLLVLAGEISFAKALFGFTLPALIGNIVGGTLIFTVLIWAQIRSDRVDTKIDEEFSYSRFWTK